MAFTEGSKVYIAFKEEQTPNVQESGAGGAVLRRTSGILNLVKQEVDSAEKRTDFQEVNVTHGTRSVDFTLNTEGFLGDYTAFLSAIMRRDFAAVPAVAASAGDGFTAYGGVLTRAAGASESFITDGLRAGMIVRLSGMAVTENNDRNFRITAITATTLTLTAVDGGLPLADDATNNEAATLTVPGQVSFIPSTAHTAKTFTIEKHDLAADVSEVARGCKIGSFELNAQPDQPVQISFSGLGIDRATLTCAEAPVLTDPTAAGAGKAVSAAVGHCIVNGDAAFEITSLRLSVDLGVQNQPVIFSDVSPDIFYGRTATVQGTITALRDNAALQQIFENETEVALAFILEAPGVAPKGFISVYLPRVKLMSAEMDDPDGPVIQSLAFRALKPASDVAGTESTVITIQDSAIA
jgi:hypothetical protein